MKPDSAAASAPPQQDVELEKAAPRTIRVSSADTETTTLSKQHKSKRRTIAYVGMNQSAEMVFNLDDLILDEEAALGPKRSHTCRNILAFVLVAGAGFAAMVIPDAIYTDEAWFTNQVELKAQALRHVLMIVPCSFALMWSLSHVLHGNTAMRHRYWTYCRLGISLLGIIAIVQLRKATVALNTSTREVADEYLWSLLFLMSVVAFSLLLDVLREAIHTMAESRERKLQRCKPIAKWRGLMQNFCRWRNEDADAVYSFAEAPSALDVLHHLAWIYFGLGKAGAFVLFFLHVCGVDITQNVVWVLVAGVFSSLVVTFNMSATVRNILSLALSNAFYTGEIISLTTPGGRLADNPGESLTGFVEAVTLTHVVLRDFRRKQTWITHDNFIKYNVCNWTRRPCRLIHLRVTVSSRVEDAAKVAQFAAFAKRWIYQHKSVDASSYRKSVIVSADKGLKLEAIFYPLPGIDSYPLRQSFVVAIVSAAKRLGLPLVPNEIITGFPDNQVGNADAVADDELDDLLATQHDAAPAAAAAPRNQAEQGAAAAAAVDLDVVSSSAETARALRK